MLTAGPKRKQTYSRETLHSIRRSNGTSADLVGDHGAHANGDRDPVRARLRTPAVQHVPYSGVDAAGDQHPQAHLGLLDAAVAPGQEDDDPVAQHAGGPADAVADQGGEEDEPRRGGAEVVGLRGEDLGDGVEGDDAGCAAEGEDEAGLFGIESVINLLQWRWLKGYSGDIR